MSAKVDSSQILRLQKKIASLDFGRLVMVNEGLGCETTAGLLDIILNDKNRQTFYIC